MDGEKQSRSFLLKFCNFIFFALRESNVSLLLNKCIIVCRVFVGPAICFDLDLTTVWSIEEPCSQTKSES